MITKFGIHLKVQNINKSFKFYNSFGLKPCFAYGRKKFISKFKNKIPTVSENYNGIVFDISGSLLEIADGHIAVKQGIFKENIKSSKISAMIYVSSIRWVLNICNKNKYKISVLPKTYPWGTKEMVIKDPDGFVLVFIEKLSK